VMQAWSFQAQCLHASEKQIGTVKTINLSVCRYLITR
jgi:hypothetical protein